MPNNNQVLFVKTPSASSIKGNMFLYERKNEKQSWKLADSFPVTVGRSGLAKDAHSVIPLNDNLPVKQEGDGKSPSGIFKLWKVFSYHNLQNLKMPFVQVDTNFYCVDDVNSRYYNQLILADTAIKDFNSFEHMKLSSNGYEYGVWVLYNSNPAIAGNGSCIFLHVWRDENTPTSGCTAMAKENMLKLIHWLDEKKNPVLLQVVEE
ncbi:L,D-transpeptidase family protein [Parafilimonas terrae]|uniref:L,D-peptidoglycan transpeptidase YkuD, ErfK/YbiS/YcfS/YnhG family n=1 Tax=Parafilimonas terrae TaxID=1465490 RepID=A0A1I5XPX7_9BACT|nr:L,D-transpeptidase family protein [Parafilimonas terrae]SFQ33886.1 L,D-peptidoglycan transpeptidase YkuD, ErfK/YbiS/YcfS/YnhG family [Parafilimonas terrae]